MGHSDAPQEQAQTDASLLLKQTAGGIDADAVFRTWDKDRQLNAFRELNKIQDPTDAVPDLTLVHSEDGAHLQKQAARPKPDLIDMAVDLWDWFANNDRPVSANALAVPGSQYRGEGIINDGFGFTRLVREGETIDSIVTEDMEWASEEVRQKYRQELITVNGIKDPDKLPPGMMLVMPGHNEQSDLILEDDDEVKRTIEKDGAVKVEKPDGSGYDVLPKPGGGYTFTHSGWQPQDNYQYVRLPDGKGGYTEKHFGKLPQDNYELVRTDNGEYQLKDSDGKLISQDANNPDPRIERAKLKDAVDQQITDPIDRLYFHENIERFDRRALTQNLSAQEQARFYQQVERLLMSENNSIEPELPNQELRLQLAAQIMSQAADPFNIDQGKWSTCGAATLEVCMFANEPSRAAGLIAEVATTGGFTGRNGTRYSLHPSLLRATDEGLSRHLPEGNRSYASQLFQGMALTTQRPAFRQIEPAAPDDTGERFTRGRDEVKFNGLLPQEISSMSRIISGKNIQVIEHARENNPGQIHIGSLQELQDHLRQQKENGGLPAIVLVDPENEPFWTDSRAGLIGRTGGGGHFVVVRDYDAKTGMVAIDNQWGKHADHKSIPAQHLYLALQHHGFNNGDLKSAVETARKSGKPDPVLELALLRRQRDAGEIQDADYDKGLLAVKARTEQSWQRELRKVDKNRDGLPDKPGTGPNRDEQIVFNWAFYQMVENLPQSRRQRIDRMARAAEQRARRN